jgi:copper homeostasis protein CutC
MCMIDMQCAAKITRVLTSSYARARLLLLFPLQEILSSRMKRIYLMLSARRVRETD